ncbi:MAG: tRNA epoxyqueuosine(34) reductase QueG [Rhodobacteraceae bacterium]|nr:tRNA epoxyqueuosine(34) reductase QueG [Paracoccaceae bacterium]
MALEVGFSDVGICAPDAMPETAGRLQEFLKAGLHGDMDWMERRAEWRGSPTALWPEARSVIMLADNYGPDDDPLKLLPMKDRGNISVYARNKDYHDPLKKRLKRLGRWLIEQEPCDIKVFVDTAPVMEKPLAQAAGLGWQGKHTNVVSRRLGSWFFLGAIFTTLDLPRDKAEPDHCGNCHACIDACPTDAFIAPYKLDPRKCISYLTIEQKGPIDPALRPLMGNRIYGCDDCLAACPWNKFAQVARDANYWARIELRCPKLEHLVALNDADFREVFAGSPIKRIGRNSFVRNVLYAIGNSGDASLAAAARPLASDPDDTVKDAANWALERLS